MVVDGARALYTSQVVALATAGLASLFLTFAGFYLTSNTIRRDLLARTGGIIAATPVSFRHLPGRASGSAAPPISGSSPASMSLNVMAMHLLRGEGPLEPFTYLFTYLLALGPAIIVVAALALMFECVPLLSGRLGDVLYFFVWAVLLAMGAMGEGGGAGKFLDVMGLGFILRPGARRQQLDAARDRHDAVPRATWRRGCCRRFRFRSPCCCRASPPRSWRCRSSWWPGSSSTASTRPGYRAGARAAAMGSSAGCPRLLKPITRIVSGVGARLVPAAPGVLRPDRSPRRS